MSKRPVTGPRKIERLFKRLKEENRCGFIAYVTCGDPDVETTVKVVEALEEAGADAIELGVPFSDPIADGPVIQEASTRALRGGTITDDLFTIATRIRMNSRIPLIAFSYLNPVLHYGIETFARRCQEAAIDSLLCTDLPPESGKEMQEHFRKFDVGLVALLAPTSPDKRVKLVNRFSDGFIYYVSTTGVTGTRRDLDPALLTRLDEVRSLVKKPLAVGFGVSTNEHYRLLAPHCEAVVVGSAIVRAIAAGDAAGAPERAAAVVREILGR